MARAASDRYPAMAGSAALHAAVLISGLIAWPWLTKPLHMGDVVPVTLITSNEAPTPRPAVQAPQPAPAATETPVPQASPPVVQPQATPTPAPPVAKAAPQPTPTPHKTAPAKPAAKPAPELDLAALSASLTKQARPASPRQSSAAPGPSRPAQAVEARTSSGASDAVSTAALASLSGELQRMWNPICDAPGAANAVIQVTFRIGSGGRLIGSPQSSQAGTTDNVVRVASERALRPIYQASPFGDPAFAVLYGQTVTVNFNQKSFCSNR
jgi:protein TonB